MNTINSTSIPPDDDDIAGEYVLGVLDAGTRRSVQTRLEVDPALADQVQAWETRLTPLFDEVAPVVTPDYVWARICNALGFSAERPRGNAAAASVRPSVWESLGFWRGISGLALASVAALAVALWLQPKPVTPPAATPGLVSTLAQDDGRAGFVAALDTQSGVLTVTPLADPPTDGRVQELWVIPNGQKPISLGVLDATKPAAYRLRQELLAQVSTNAIFAVTLEPAGGAPGGNPTGPIIAKGSIALL